jgi:hypothetical protein
MSAPFANVEELNAFVTELRTDLDAAGLSDAAKRLAEIQNTAYTTGSEWQGELKRAVRSIFRQEQRLPEDLVARMVRVLGPSLSERMAQQRYWAFMFNASAALLLLAAIATVGLLATGRFERYASISIGGLLAAAAVLWIAVRKSTICPGCDLRSQRPTRPYCGHCGMHRSSGSPGPRARPMAGSAPSPVMTCPDCGKPPGGRGRSGRTLPSEGLFCELCGASLPAA